MARPKGQTAQHLRNLAHVPFSEAEKILLTKCAQGKPLATWIREELLRVADESAPPPPRKTTRKRLVVVPLTDAQKTLLDKLASAEGMRLATWIRERILRLARLENKD